MKIGILTYHSVYNFGANLQTLSTVYYLKRNGYEPIIINWRPWDVWNIYKKIVSENQIRAHEDFFKTFYPLTKECYTNADVARIIDKEKIEALIIGSDAVLSHVSIFRKLSLGGRRILKWFYVKSTDCYPNPFWGSFKTKILTPLPTALMSVSAQNTRYHSIILLERNILKRALKRFSYISVRDEWTRDMVNYLTNGDINPPITPDPVFAFNNNVPSEIFDHVSLDRFGLPSKYILISFKPEFSPGSTWIERFVGLCKENGLTCYFLPFPYSQNDYEMDFQLKLPISPLEWYALIKNSQGYVGNNMHPIVVSLHNAVPFFSFDNYGFAVGNSKRLDLRSSKIFDIVRRCGFEKNYQNIVRRDRDFIQPEVVLKRLLCFDREKCNRMGRERFEKYETFMREMMINLLGHY